MMDILGKYLHNIQGMTFKSRFEGDVLWPIEKGSLRFPGTFKKRWSLLCH